MRIERLRPEREAEYDRFLRESPDRLFFFSNKYRQLLRALLNAEDHYLLAIGDNGAIRAALPAFLIQGPFGPVLNSLPYYGSNGGVIRDKGDAPASKALIDAFFETAQARRCASATVISSPLDSDPDLYARLTGADLTDMRVGQLTALDPALADAGDDEFMAPFHYKTRNMIRKAAKLGVVVREERSPEAFRFLLETHEENMRDIGGLQKSHRFFDLVEQQLECGPDYRVYTAWKDDARVAALLVLFFNRVVEYCTPVIKKEFRDYQGLSLAIAHAMRDAMREGYQWWNWGGTWLSQDGVYRFKKRWGTLDMNYHYYTRIFDRSLLSRSAAELVSAYPGFYVLPFSALKTTPTQ